MRERRDAPGRFATAAGKPATDAGGRSESGVIAYHKGKTGPFGLHPKEVEAWLALRCGEPAPGATPASGAPPAATR